MHPALKTNIYKQAYKLFKQRKAFTLIDTNKEHKLFDPNNPCSEYTVTWLRNYFKIAYELDAPIMAVTY